VIAEQEAGKGQEVSRKKAKKGEKVIAKGEGEQKKIKSD